MAVKVFNLESHGHYLKCPIWNVMAKFLSLKLKQEVFYVYINLYENVWVDNRRYGILEIIMLTVSGFI